MRQHFLEQGLKTVSYTHLIFTPFYLDGLAKIFLNQNHLPSKNMVMDEIISQRFENDDDKFINCLLYTSRCV